MNILVFGGGGFLGSYVVDELIEFGHQVEDFDVKPSPYVNKLSKFIIGDVMDAAPVPERYSE